jgi:lipopolysaccharide transport system permease protein
VPSPSFQSPTAPDPDAEPIWDQVVEPHRGLFDLQWHELWKYRDLILMLAQRDISASYKQTVLGPFWFVLQPVLITAVFSYLFGRMGHFGTDDVPHYLFYMSGLVLWGFFSESVLKTCAIFTQNQQLFSKVYFPRMAVPIAGVLTNLLPLAVQFALFFIGLVYYLVSHNPFVHPNWWMVLTPLLFVQLGALALGVGCIVSALTRRFRDLAFGIKVGMQLWMFGSAIVFPLSRLAPGDRWVFFLNPVVPPIEAFRGAFLGVTLLQPWHLASSAIISFLTLFIGVVLFNRAEQTAMDTV